MTGLQFIFLLIGAITLATAVLVVTVRRIMRAALLLIVALFGVAGIFATLEAGFFTAIQIAVYIGAIAILIIFAVMLTRFSNEDVGPQLIRSWPIVLVICILALAGLVFLNLQFPAFAQSSRQPLLGGENLVNFGQALVAPNGYLVPFEAASVLLIAALIGAIFVAGEPKGK